MIQKIVAYVVIAAFLTSTVSPLLAQQDVEQIAGRLGIAEKEKIGSSDEVYKKFTCPSCERDFEVKVDPNDTQLKKGLKKLTCPYDGTEFYPRAFAEREEQLQYENIKCPSCGREFRGYIDIKALLAGQPQLLTCPYDKKKFYFKAEAFQQGVFSYANLYTVICPTCTRTFKAYLFPDNQTELTCPHDGTKFFPTPELILQQTGTTGAQTGPILSAIYPSGTPNLGTTGAQQGFPFSPEGPGNAPFQYYPAEEKYSRIEKMFLDNIPLTVPKNIRQFGYEIFAPVEETTGLAAAKQEEKGRKDEGAAEASLFKKLLGGSTRQGDIFSADDLKGGLSELATPAGIPAMSDYVLGPGDTLVITVWGQIQENMPVTIDAEGKILLPKVGPLYLWGKKFNDAEKLIKENMLRAYTNIQISVSMSRLRSIKVFVLGEVRRPGGYTISSLSNMFHALYAAGGPAKSGSMRAIKLVRKGSADMPIDLYGILLRGDNSQDYKLQANDTIFVPSIGSVVGVLGNVKRPAIYELNEKIKLNDAVEMAGGLLSIGYVQRIQLERIQDHLRKIVVDLEFKSLSDLKESPNNIELQDGDLVTVFPITSLRHNFVSVCGNVLRPGDYELKEGMRLKDVIDKAGGVLPGTYLKRAEIARFRGDQTREVLAVDLSELMDQKEGANIALKEWDVITVYAKKDILPTLFIEIDGAVNKPGRYELTDNMKVSDLIFRGGGLKRNASLSNAELFRTFSDAGSKLFTIDVQRVLSKEAGDPNTYDLPLEGGDNLFIREDVSREEKIIIALSGEFKYPGNYAVEKGTHLSAVIERAGGFTRNAFIDGCIYNRESVKIAQQKMIKRFLDSEQQAMLQEQSSLAIGLTGPQADARSKLIEYRQKLMQELGSVDVPGRILVRLQADMRKFKMSEYDIIIEDNDTLQVPSYPSTVQVVGNVYGPSTVAFGEGRGIDYYLNKVGGLTQHADANRIFIIRANGETVSNFIRAVRVRRGDTIVVPEEYKYRTLPGIFFKDIVQVVYQATMGAVVTIAAINTL